MPTNLFLVVVTPRLNIRSAPLTGHDDPDQVESLRPKSPPSLLRKLKSRALNLTRHALTISTRVIPMFFQEDPKPLILTLQIAILIRDHEPRDQSTDGRKPSTNQEHSLLALESIVERVLDRSEDLCSNGSTSLSYSRGKPKIVAPQWRGKAFARDEEGAYPGTHFAEAVEDAVEDDEEREYGLDGLEGPADDEAHDGPAGETEGPMGTGVSKHLIRENSGWTYMVCLRPILSMRKPPTMQPGR